MRFTNCTATGISCTQFAILPAADEQHLADALKRIRVRHNTLKLGLALYIQRAKESL